MFDVNNTINMPDESERVGAAGRRWHEPQVGLSPDVDDETLRAARQRKYDEECLTESRAAAAAEVGLSQRSVRN